MQRVREATDRFLIATNDALYAWRVWVPDFWNQGVHRWFILLLMAAAIMIALLLRRDAAGRRERALFRLVSGALAEASTPTALISLVFATVFRGGRVVWACFYLAAAPGSPLLLQSKQTSREGPGGDGTPATDRETGESEVTRVERPVRPRPDWMPERRLESILGEPSITQKGLLSLFSLPITIDGHPLGLVQMATLTPKDAGALAGAADFLRALLTPILARYASLERIQRLEDRTLEAAVISRSSQVLLNTTLGLDHLGQILLDLLIRSTESDAGLILLDDVESGRPRRRTLASAGLDPDRLEALAATAPRPGAPGSPDAGMAGTVAAPRAGFRSVLPVPIGADASPLGVILLAKRDGAFHEGQRRICQLNATRLTLSLKNRAYHEAVFDEYKDTLGAIVATHEASHRYSAGHSGRIARLAGELADLLGVAPDEAQGIRLAGELHDVGMVGLGTEILLKAGRLTEQEYDLVRHHPVIGAALTSPIRLPVPIAPLILHHHERYDGLGYPAGLHGSEIPLGARILALGEVFDALVTPRTYREALAFPDAVTRLGALSGSQLDPALVELFIQTVTAEKWVAISREESARPAQ